MWRYKTCQIESPHPVVPDLPIPFARFWTSVFKFSIFFRSSSHTSCCSFCLDSAAWQGIILLTKQIVDYRICSKFFIARRFLLGDLCSQLPLITWSYLECSTCSRYSLSQLPEPPRWDQAIIRGQRFAWWTWGKPWVKTGPKKWNLLSRTF